MQLAGMSVCYSDMKLLINTMQCTVADILPPWSALITLIVLIGSSEGSFKDQWGLMWGH